MVMGIDPGSKEICEELGIIHVPDVELNEFGTPILSSMFTEAEKRAKNEVMALISSDIIVFDDAIAAAARLLHHLPHGFMGGVHRYDKHIEGLIDFTDPDWVGKTRIHLSLGHPGCGDFFLIKKGTYVNGVLPFAVGRASADNWLVHEATRLGCSVDMTPVVTILHQNHDHSHIPGDLGGMISGPEFKKNRDLVGGGVHSQIADSSWVLTHDNLVRR